MNSDIEAQTIEALGPIVLVVVPDWHFVCALGDNLRNQYKDLAIGSRERFRIKGGKEIQIISAACTEAMRGRVVDNLIIHPRVYDLPNIQRIIDVLVPCLRHRLCEAGKA